MALTFKETQALSDLASHLYAYLPASGAIYTFGEAAREAGVAECWPGVKMMSKQPAITTLVENVYGARREALVLDAQGRPHTIYRDFTTDLNGAEPSFVTHAVFDGGAWHTEQIASGIIGPADNNVPVALSSGIPQLIRV